jgi:hypothetical protein
MTRKRMAWVCGVALMCLMLTGMTVRAHDPDTGLPNWITNGHYLSPDTGVHCCGPRDCERLDPGLVEATPGGLILHAYDDEVVPYSEATPSEDGHFWRCHGSNQQRRCFFAPVGTQ